MAEYKPGDILENAKGDRIILTDRWEPLNRESITRLRQMDLEAFEYARQQAKQIGADPLFQELMSQAGAEGRRSFGKALLNIAPSAAASVATGGISGVVGTAARTGAQGVAELIRQAITGEKIDPEQAAVSAALNAGYEGAAAAGAGLLKGLARKSPGVNARLAERELAKTQELVEQSGLALDKSAVEAAYQEFKDLLQQQGVGKVRLSATSQALAEVINEMKRRPAAARQPAILSRFTRLSTQSGQGGLIGFDEVDSLLKDINAAIKATTNSNEKRLLMEAKKHVFDDLQQANVPAQQREALKKAIKTAREAFARGDLHDAIQAGISTSNVTGYEIINPKRILDELRWLKKNDPLFSGSFAPGQLERFENFLVKMTQELRGHSPEGTAIILGSLGGLAGAGIGQTFEATGAGASIGAAVGVSTPSLFTKLALNPITNELILRMFRTGKPIARPILVALANAATAGLRGLQQQPEQTPSSAEAR